MPLDRKRVITLAALAVGALAVIAGAIWWMRRAARSNEGTIALCAPEDPRATSVLVIDAFDYTSSKGATTHERRALVPLDTRTGTAGARFEAGETAECLGGVGPNVLVATKRDGLHVRDPATGAIVATEASLLGASAGHLASWTYDALAHKLVVRTTFGDSFAIDALSQKSWTTRPVPAAEAQPNPHTLVVLETFSSHTAFYGAKVGETSNGSPVLETVGTRGLACEGSQCRLGTREVDGYGNGTSLTPIAGADILLVAHGVFAVRDRGVLVSRLTALDEKTRELAFVGFDGKVKWTLPAFKQRYYTGWSADDMIVLAYSESGSAIAKRQFDAHLIDRDGRVVWSVAFPSRSGAWWDDKLKQVAVRYGDDVLLGAQGLVVAMPIGAGVARWRFEP